jgi:hypothetical protein
MSIFVSKKADLRLYASSELILRIRVRKPNSSPCVDLKRVFCAASVPDKPSGTPTLEMARCISVPMAVSCFDVAKNNPADALRPAHFLSGDPPLSIENTWFCQLRVKAMRPFRWLMPKKVGPVEKNAE